MSGHLILSRKHYSRAFFATIFFAAFLTKADINWDGDNPLGNFSIAQNWYSDTSPTWGFASGNLVFNFRNNSSQTSLYYDLAALIIFFSR